MNSREKLKLLAQKIRSNADGLATAYWRIRGQAEEVARVAVLGTDRQNDIYVQTLLEECPQLRVYIELDVN